MGNTWLHVSLVSYPLLKVIHFTASIPLPKVIHFTVSTSSLVWSMSPIHADLLINHAKAQFEVLLNIMAKKMLLPALANWFNCYQNTSLLFQLLE